MVMKPRHISSSTAFPSTSLQIMECPWSAMFSPAGLTWLGVVVLAQLKLNFIQACSLASSDYSHNNLKSCWICSSKFTALFFLCWPKNVPHVCESSRMLSVTSDESAWHTSQLDGVKVELTWPNATKALLLSIRFSHELLSSVIWMAWQCQHCTAFSALINMFYAYYLNARSEDNYELWKSDFKQQTNSNSNLLVLSWNHCYCAK